MESKYTQLDEVLAIAGRIIASDDKCRRVLEEKQKMFGSEYKIALDSILLKPGGREAVIRALFLGHSEGCEIIVDVDREIVRLVKNYLR